MASHCCQKVIAVVVVVAVEWRQMGAVYPFMHTAAALYRATSTSAHLCVETCALLDIVRCSIAGRSLL
jgi:hypothetical protein